MRIKEIAVEIFEKIKGLDRKTLVVGAAGLFMIIAVATVAGYKISNHPQFCRGCHLMDPYVDAILSSSHGNLSCGDCHYEPGFINGLRDKAVFGTSSMVAQVTGDHGERPIVVTMKDSSCLQCHKEERLIEEKILYKKGIVFSHKNHFEAGLGEKRLKCVACHTQVKSSVHMEVLSDACIVCHFTEQKDKKTLACKKCHSLPALMKMDDENHIETFAEESDCSDCHEIESVKSTATEKECSKCHVEEEKKIGELSTGELHDAHMGHKTVYCLECHSPVAHGEEEEE